MLQKIKENLTLWEFQGIQESLRTGKLNLRTRLAICLLKRMVEKMNSSWKTTLCGAIGAIGIYLSTLKDPAWLSIVGTVLSALSSAGLGAFARDNDKSSEQVGAGNTGPNQPK